MHALQKITRSALAGVTLALFGSVATAQLVPPPTDFVDASASVCRTRTLGVLSRNPDILSETSGALLEEGGSWDTQIDVSTFAPGTVTLILAAEHRRIRRPGLSQIILIDPATILARRSAIHDGVTPVNFSIDIPNDPALCDVDAWVQAVVMEGSNVTLSNGLHVYVGN